MSADTAKENVSTVDSSLSQKHNVGNFEEPGIDISSPFFLIQAVWVLLPARIFIILQKKVLDQDSSMMSLTCKIIISILLPA